MGIQPTFARVRALSRLARVCFSASDVSLFRCLPAKALTSAISTSLSSPSVPDPASSSSETSEARFFRVRLNKQSQGSQRMVLLSENTKMVQLGVSIALCWRCFPFRRNLLLLPFLFKISRTSCQTQKRKRTFELPVLNRSANQSLASSGRYVALKTLKSIS